MSIISFKKILLTLFLALGACVSTAHSGSQHDSARAALQNGKVMSLQQVLSYVKQEYGGEPVKIEFNHAGSLYIYKIKLIKKDGSLVKLKLDASNGKALSVRQRQHR